MNNEMEQVLPSNSVMLNMAKEGNLYDRETAMYSVAFNELNQVRQEAGLSKEDVPLQVPSVYYVHIEEAGDSNGLETCVLMQDLSTSGFRMTDKHAGCDDDHVRLALYSLANFHALSMAALKKWTDGDGRVVLPPAMQFMTGKSIVDNFKSEHMVAWFKPMADRMRNNDRPEVGIIHFKVSLRVLY